MVVAQDPRASELPERGSPVLAELFEAVFGLGFMMSPGSPLPCPPGSVSASHVALEPYL